MVSRVMDEGESRWFIVSITDEASFHYGSFASGTAKVTDHIKDHYFHK